MSVGRRRIAILAEGKFNVFAAKTAAGVIRYSPHQVVAVIDSETAGRNVQEVLGFGGDTPIVRSVSEAMRFKPDVLLIGIAPTGGQLPGDWRHVISDALENHLEIWSGLHFFIGQDEEFAELAEMKGVRIWDVRRPRQDLRVGDGSALKTKAFVLLTVGSDCNVGKMTAALELEKIARERGYKPRFVATGQTGILIEGEGTPLDAVPGDFMSGEVERFVTQYDSEGANCIFVEGQGAVAHPGFGPVTLGLMLGSMPDAFLLVHQPLRKTYRPDYDVPLPDLRTVIAQYENLIAVYKAPKVLAVALNTYEMDEAQAETITREIEEETGLTTVDPIRHGAKKLFDVIEPAIKRKLAQRGI